MTKPSVITVDVFKRVSGSTSKDFCCHLFENGQSRLVFSGDTADEAERLALDWANSVLLTPERIERMRVAAAKRVEARKKRKSSEARK